MVERDTAESRSSKVMVLVELTESEQTLTLWDSAGNGDPLVWQREDVAVTERGRAVVRRPPKEVLKRLLEAL